MGARRTDNGAIWTSLQGPGGGSVAAAGEFFGGIGIPRDWRGRGDAGALAQRGAVQARFDAVLTTAAMDEAGKSAWCREHGVYPQELSAWRRSATEALAKPAEARASPQQTRQDRRRIKELERELRRKDKALAETAALLVLSKKVAAIFHKGEDE